MSSVFTVSLANLIQELSLETAYMPEDPEKILISSRDINRPGLELTGFLDFFDKTRIIILGNTESAYLSQLACDQKIKILTDIIEKKPPAVIVARNLPLSEELMEICKQYQVPVLRSADATSSLSAALVSHLNVELAPRVTRHGVLGEVYGEGILLIGDSGVGKSETAIELIKRGHRLIADDAV